MLMLYSLPYKACTKVTGWVIRVKEIIHSKIEYLELLMESPEGELALKLKKFGMMLLGVRHEKLCFDYIDTGVPSDVKMENTGIG